VEAAPEIIARMRDAVPVGRERLDDAALGLLRDLTQALVASKPEAQREYGRFLAMSQRSIGLPDLAVQAWLRDKTVLVTGGTGCIGSTLMAQLDRFGPRRLVSVSRGSTPGSPRLERAEYARADVRDRGRLAEIFDDVRPDVVFHLAAQRDPGLAEHEVHRTVTTNVLGTRNVIGAAAESGAAEVVCASTGKALRPYSPDVYTASKRVAEWLLSQAAARGGASYSAARFTHVVNNSIIYARLLEWCQGGMIRLHSPDITFYAQSALESAQLMLGAGVSARPGSLWVHAITDLGWPVSLLDVALGVLARTGSAAPIYFSGYDRGYEAAPFPGLYDPLTAGDVSPLLSAFEAPQARQSSCPAADAFPLEVASSPALDERMLALEDACARTREPPAVRAALDDLSWSLLDATLEVVPREVLARAAKLTAPHRIGLNAEHQRMLTAIERHAAVGESAIAALSGGSGVTDFRRLILQRQY
jgi:nucleoside-diphosphate-sugar epimerase